MFHRLGRIVDDNSCAAARAKDRAGLDEVASTMHPAFPNREITHAIELPQIKEAATCHFGDVYVHVLGDDLFHLLWLLEYRVLN